MPFYEMRQYKVLPGKMDDFVAAMERDVIPFQVANGMVIAGSFRGETDDSVYFWIRRFESEEQRAAQYAAVYESDRWKKEIAPNLIPMLDPKGIVVTRVVPTAISVLR